MKKVFLGIILVLIVGCSKEGSSEDSLKDVDGNVYTSITIGKQTWYKENLNVSKYSDGTIIPEVSDPSEWSTLTTGAWSYLDYDSSNGKKIGKLYNWYAVAGIFDTASLTDMSIRKKLAPVGNHIPTDAEWTTMINSLGSNAGSKMKESGTNYWIDTDTDVTNSSLFTGLPGGMCIKKGGFYFAGEFGYWWTSTSINVLTAWNRSLGYNSPYACRSYDDKNYGFSVRFIKD
ncbi:fibrobacter succinogenes major paralogous domain-containing protein [Flavobacterium sp.]|uniref:fibrobacter succinogenes major paralogous domain-containing protein n=1 Tax=Flavobacterium sp. TaxID=239 RepID=UPI0038FC7EC4